MKLKNNKSPGYDYIINENIKISQDLLCSLFVKQFNKVLDEGVFPLEWTIWVTVPLYKKQRRRQKYEYVQGNNFVELYGKIVYFHSGPSSQTLLRY